MCFFVIAYELLKFLLYHWRLSKCFSGTVNMALKIGRDSCCWPALLWQYFVYIPGCDEMLLEGTLCGWHWGWYCAVEAGPSVWEDKWGGPGGRCLHSVHTGGWVGDIEGCIALLARLYEGPMKRTRRPLPTLSTCRWVGEWYWGRYCPAEAGPSVWADQWGGPGGHCLYSGATVGATVLLLCWRKRRARGSRTGTTRGRPTSSLAITISDWISWLRYLVQNLYK